jgi:type 1 fimbria pilin
VTALSAAHAEAQSVKVKVNGTVVSTTTTNNDDIVVSLGTVTSNTLVQVYADESTPSFGVNSITLDGAVSGTPVVR